MPRQVLSGRHDPIAGRRYSRRLAKQLDCPVLITGAPALHVMQRDVMSRPLPGLLGNGMFPCPYPDRGAASDARSGVHAALDKRTSCLQRMHTRKHPIAKFGASPCVESTKNLDLTMPIM